MSSDENRHDSLPSQGDVWPVCEYSPVDQIYDEKSSVCMDRSTDFNVNQTITCLRTSHPTPFFTPEADSFCQALPTHVQGSSSSSRPSSGRELKQNSCPAVGSQLNPSVFGAFELIINPAWQNSSTGIIATHTILIPDSESLLIFSRQINTLLVPTQPNMAQSVAVAYDTATGVYTPAPMPQNPFCAGHTHLLDGTLFVAGGEEGGMLGEGIDGWLIPLPSASPPIALSHDPHPCRLCPLSLLRLDHHGNPFPAGREQERGGSVRGGRLRRDHRPLGSLRHPPAQGLNTPDPTRGQTTLIMGWGGMAQATAAGDLGLASLWQGIRFEAYPACPYPPLRRFYLI